MSQYTTAYGNFHNFCRDSTLPVCNLFSEAADKGGAGYGGCALLGIPLSGGTRRLTNLGVIILDGLSVLIALFLLWRTQRKRAAVGRREMQLFLFSFLLLSICEIFSIGGFPLKSSVRIGFSAAHLGMFTATTWILMLNGAVGYQALNDGSFISIVLILGSAAAMFVGTGFIALDTGLNLTGYFNSPMIQADPNRSYSLYTLWILAPLVFLAIYFILETWLVLRILGEIKPMLFLLLAALFFAAGQVFDYVISTHICNGVKGKIDGSLFQTLCTLIAVAMVWTFWSSITEDDWPTIAPGEEPYGGQVDMEHRPHVAAL